MSNQESTVVAFVPYDKCAGLTCKPRAYYCDGKGRDYYITHDLYEQGTATINRANNYDYSSNVFHGNGLKKNWHTNADNYRTGRTKFKRYFGNGTGKDGFVIRNNGGNYRETESTASLIKDFKNQFRCPVDKSIKMEDIKRKKEMNKNIHAMEMGKRMKEIKIQKQLDDSNRLSFPKFKNEKYLTNSVNLRYSTSELPQSRPTMDKVRISADEYDLLIKQPRFRLNKINSVDFIRAKNNLFGNQQNNQEAPTQAAI